MESFKCHEGSREHNDRILKIPTLPWTTKDVGERLSQAHAKGKKERRQCFFEGLFKYQGVSKARIGFLW